MRTDELDIGSPVLVHIFTWYTIDRPCGLVVRVPGYRFRGLDSIPSNQIF
jgi:hypothetical protein